MTRREFQALLAAGPLQVAGRPSGPVSTGSHIGNLKQWQKLVRAKVFEHMFYAPPRPQGPDSQPRVTRRTDRGDYIEESITFQTTPDLRVPAFVLIPKHAKLPAPGVVALHDHGGFYLWGKEKLIQSEGEHPALTKFRQDSYSGRSIAVELARQGYVVIVIDMFYWGERRMILDDDPPAYRDRPASMPAAQVQEFNRRSQEGEELVARSLFTAGITWPGIMLWDDIRTVDYLCTRPEVDPQRVACVGLSVGGYRSLMLAALDERIRAAVSVCFMESYPYQIRRNVIHSTGFTFHLIGLLRYLDLPDLSALIAPRPVLFINGARDGLFNQKGIQAAYAKVERCYAKAGVPTRQVCRFYDSPHQFNADMQAEAWPWLQKWL